MARFVPLLVALAVLCSCAGRPQTQPSAPAPEPQGAPSVAQIQAQEPDAVTEAVEPDVPELELPDVEPDPPQPEPASEGPATTRDLCEPVDSRRGYPTKAQRRATIALLERTCEVMGVDEPSCQFFRLVSHRESSYRPWVRHKMHGDVSNAANAYLSSSTRYGWLVLWRMKDRQRADLGAIELSPRKRPGVRQNPYFVEVERWLTGGLGLGGLNVGYHLVKFDRVAPPEILCDPVVNVMVQITIARNAVDRYGAQNWYEVQAVYAGRTYHDRQGRARPLSCSRGCPSHLSEERQEKARRADARLRKRCKAQKMDCMATPVLGDVLRKGGKAEDRYDLAEKVRGRPLPPFDEPLPTVRIILGDS